MNFGQTEVYEPKGLYTPKTNIVVGTKNPTKKRGVNMEINIDGGVIINGVNLKSRKIRIENGRVGLYLDYTDLPVNAIKHLATSNMDIVKDGKIVLNCNNDCLRCPMCEDYQFRIYAQPRSFTLENGYRCALKGKFAENIAALAKSRVKHASEIEVKKGFDVVNKKFYRKQAKYITEQTIKEVITEIDECLTPQMYEHYDEYGGVRIDLDSIHIEDKKYGYILTCDGRMGDYGLYTKIYIHKRCDIQALKSRLRDRYYKKYRTDIKEY